ncbi:interleukin-10 receptor subunit beta-like [Sphaeramia orbicularis]|uniref:interleukin-10 receptor subunit beta-like n=1 Tax=Sphaeramia orbicularis TaxID=375764 RepID=UPI0011801217|nr:interleukin-10 receptor subunit beta-like [Sphaeramia orbicularis]
MSALVLLLLTSTAVGPSTVVSEVLGSPRNVSLTSYNMNLVLRWEPPEGITDNVIYTTQLKPSGGQIKEACVNVSTLQCDITNLGITIFQFARYTGAVRAVSGSRSSNWVYSNNLTMDEHTIIGPPAVSLVSSGVDIEVSITDPVFSISELRRVYSTITYSIIYWKEGQKEQAKNISKIQQNRVSLSGLDPTTKYCVQVRVDVDPGRNRSPGQLSDPVCESTTNEGAAPWVEGVVVFVTMAATVAMVVLGVVYHKRIKHFFCPKDRLPAHFIEKLLAHPNIPIQISDPPKETCNQLTMITDEGTVEELHPLEAVQAHCSQPDVTVEET